MQCSKCSGQNDASNKYCESCGAQLKIKCAACGHSNEPTSRFCGQCGTELLVPAARDEYSSQQILRTLSVKGGERKHLTVLFADIRNSTRLIDNLGDPELGMRRLKPILELMKEAVHRYNGTVNKTQGDGVMALFGAPLPQEDHAVCGCLAALAMVEAIFSTRGRGNTGSRGPPYGRSCCPNCRKQHLPNLRRGGRECPSSKSHGANGRW